MTARWSVTTLLLGIVSKYAEKEGLTPFVIFLLEKIEDYALKKPVLRTLYTRIQLIKVEEISITELAFSYRNMLVFCGSDAHSIKEAVENMILPTAEEEKRVFESGILEHLSSQIKERT